MNTLAILSTSIGIVSAIGAGGYALSEKLGEKATVEQVMVAEGKADYVLDVQMTNQLRQINRLEEKSNKTQDDREQLRYLREDLKEMREVRKK